MGRTWVLNLKCLLKVKRVLKGIKMQPSAPELGEG